MLVFRPNFIWGIMVDVIQVKCIHGIVLFAKMQTFLSDSFKVFYGVFLLFMFLSD